MVAMAAIIEDLGFHCPKRSWSLDRWGYVGSMIGAVVSSNRCSWNSTRSIYGMTGKGPNLPHIRERTATTSEALRKASMIIFVKHPGRGDGLCPLPSPPWTAPLPRLRYLLTFMMTTALVIAALWQSPA